MARNQHWVPRFYLRGFSDSSDRIQAYRKIDDKFFAAKAESLCGKRDLYEVRYTGVANGKAGEFCAQNFIEKSLSEFEGRVGPFYGQLLDCCDHGELEGRRFLDGRLALCALVANLIVRHPKIMSLERAKAGQLAAEFRERNELTESDYMMLEQWGWREDYRALAELAIEQTLLFSTDERVPATRICNALCTKHLSILEAPMMAAFVTTSMPMFVAGPEDDSYAFGIAYIPLNNKYAAVLSERRLLPAFSTLNHSGVRLANRLLLLNCPYWDIAMSGQKGPLGLAVQDWRLHHVG